MLRVTPFRFFQHLINDVAHRVGDAGDQPLVDRLGPGLLGPRRVDWFGVENVAGNADHWIDPIDRPHLGHAFWVRFLARREPRLEFVVGFRLYGGGAWSQVLGSHDDALAVHGENQRLVGGHLRTRSVRIEAVNILGRPSDELFDLPFAYLLARLVRNRLDRRVK